MTRFVRCVAILFLFSFWFFAGALEAAEKDAEILMIRPQKLKALVNQETNQLKRDPFNWSNEQISRFRSSDREKRSRVFAGLQLTGIIWDAKRPVAIINGKMLAPGDKINGATVKKIYKESVLLRKDGINYGLEFDSSIIGLKSRK